MAQSTTATSLPLTDELRDEIVERVVSAFAPDRVILFGSYAEGGATPDSDVDLLVVTATRLGRKEQMERMRGLFRDMPLPVQVVTISRQQFKETRDVIGGIAYPATKYGQVVYARS